MRILNLEVTDVGPFDTLQLDFPSGTDPKRADTVLFVGPNGSGKSSLLYAIAGCFSINSQELSDRFRSPEAKVNAEVMIAGTKTPIQVLTNSRASLDRPHLTNLLKGVESGLYSRRLKISDQRLFSDSTPPESDSAHLLFVYSSTRTIGAEKTSTDPSRVSDSITWDKPYTFAAFESWVRDVLLRSLTAESQNRKEEAEQLRAGLVRLEAFLSKIVGKTIRVESRTTDGQIVLAGVGTPTPLYLLPEGLKSLLSWMGDLLRRLYSLPMTGIAHHELPIVLLLDEIEVHLHPKWQRLVIPAVETLLPNAQIFLSTHSPFVIGSATDATIVWLSEEGREVENSVKTTLRGIPYESIFHMMGVDSFYDEETSSQLRDLAATADAVGRGDQSMDEFEEKATKLNQTEHIELAIEYERSVLRKTLQSRAA
jgi:predicted ATP-binding protein involved in virulence